MKSIIKTAGIYAGILLVPIWVLAQDDAQDVLPGDEIRVVRAFEPEVNLVSKVNFPPNLPKIAAGDKPKAQQYSFGDYSTSLSYEPEDLRPLKYNPIPITNESMGYLRAGFGNYLTPILNFGIANKDHSKYRVGLNTDFIHSKASKTPFKQYYEFGLEGFGEYYLNNATAGVRVGLDMDRYHLYGMSPEEAENMTKKDVSRAYTVPKFELYFYNHNPNKWNLNFAGNIGFEVAKTNFGNKAVNVNYGLNVHRSFLGDTYKAGVELDGQFNGNTTEAIKKNISGMALRPYGTIRKSIWSLELGPVLMITNGNLYVLPSFQNRIKILEDKLVMYNEWNSEIGYNNLISVYRKNPFLAGHVRYSNYRFQERAILGFRGAVAQGFYYDLKFAQNVWNNAPLLINDTSDFKQFIQVFDEKISAWNGHIEIGYEKQSQYGAKAAFDFYNYKTRTEAEAWHMPKFKFTIAGNYVWNKKLFIGAELVTLGGIKALDYEGNSVTLKTQVDLNFNATYQFKDFLGVYAEVNNVLNNKQPGWFGYERYGFHGIGGVKINF